MKLSNVGTYNNDVLEIDTDPYICFTAQRTTTSQQMNLPLYWRITQHVSCHLLIEIDSKTGAFREFKITLFKGVFNDRRESLLNFDYNLNKGVPFFKTDLWVNYENSGYFLRNENLYEHDTLPELYLDDKSFLVMMTPNQKVSSGIEFESMIFLLNGDSRLIGIDFPSLDQSNIVDLQKYAKKFS